MKSSPHRKHGSGPDDTLHGAPQDDDLLQAEPISRKRMDLLWLDPPHLAQVARLLAGREIVTVTVGSLPEDMRDNAFSRDDLAWAQRIEKIVDKAFAAGQHGELGEAIRRYKQALLAAPGCDLFLMSVGVAYFQSGEKGLALRYLERASEISPHNGRIRRNLEQVRGT
jgi:tetratricopeptide (TPR) repeat protein